MSANGFSLIELILVLVLIGILSSYAVVKAPDKHPFLLRSQTQLLLTHIRHTQKLAMTWHQPLRLYFTATNYCVSVDLASSSCSSPIIDPTTGKNFSVNLVAGTSLSNASLDFDTLGRPVSSAVLKTSVTSISLSMGGETENISIQAISGFAEIL